MGYFKNIYNSRYVLMSLVERDIVSKYRRSILGVAWTLITPLCMVGVIGIVYSVVFGTPLVDFIPFLFSGLTPWFFITACAESGAMAYIVAEGFITQTRTEIDIFPLRIVLVGFVNYGFMLLAYFIVYALLRPDAFSLRMLLTIPASLILFIFGVGFANIVAIINLYIRDYAYIQSIALQCLFYITPIIYSIDMMKQRGFDVIYLYNPLHYLIDIIRQSMLGAVPAALSSWLIAGGIALGTFISSLILLKCVGRKIVFKF